MKFGRRIRNLREKAGISQRKLAESAKVDPSIISRIESGKGNPTLSTMQQLASALGVPFTWLFIWEDEEDGRAA